MARNCNAPGGLRMNKSSEPSNDKLFVTRALEATIHIGLVVLLFYWCFKIGQPFIQIIVWGIIIAVAIHPGYNRLKSALGGRGRLAATLITLVALIVLLVPSYMLSESLINTAQEYSAKLDAGTLHVPPPSESVRSWPVIGEPLYKFWSLASNNLEVALSKITPQLKKFGIPLLSAAAGAGVGILKFVVSIIIAGVLLANDTGGGQAAQAIAARLFGERGANTVELAMATVRSVTLGILGVALIQTLLASLGFLLVGVPGAGLWALLVLILAVVQLPTILVLGPIIIYVFSTSGTVIAVVFAIWSILVGISDAFLKPLLMGRGVDVPMLVIFIGAIGGFMTSGIIGLFVGAIIFSIGYKLFLIWLNMDIQPEGEPSKPE
jgi:predicted PurR-regulated permease PerM